MRAETHWRPACGATCALYLTSTIAAPILAYQNNVYKLQGVSADGAEGISDTAGRNCLLFGQVLGRPNTDEVPVMQYVF
jgi:hypothetical protein